MNQVRIAGVPEPYNLPWHLGMEKGRFAVAGIDLEWHTVPEGTGRMCQMLRNDELDMAVLVTEGAVRDILNGGPHRIVSTFVVSPLPWGVHVPANSSLFAPEDLKGVPFAISRIGSGSHLMALMYAHRQGWSPIEEDFHVVHNMEGAAARMKDGRPLVFLWEQFVTSRYVDEGVMRKVDMIEGDWPGFVIVAREAFLDNAPGTVTRALDIVRNEVKALLRNRGVLRRIMRNAGFPPTLAKAWLKHVRWHLAPIDPGMVSGLERQLRATGMVD